MKGLAAFLAIFLSTIAISLDVAAQPWPVDALIQSSLPYPGRTFEYRVYINASKTLDVIVRATVHIPGVGWTGWRDLWRGYMRPGEMKTLSGSVEIPVEAVPGCIVVWVSILFASPEDYQMIEGVRYYSSREFIDAVTVTGPGDEALRELYKMCIANLTVLQGNITKLIEERTNLRMEISKLSEENKKLKTLCASLEEEEELVRKLEIANWQVRNLYLLLPVTAFASAIAGALSVYLVLVNRRFPKTAAQPPPPPPPV